MKIEFVQDCGFTVVDICGDGEVWEEHDESYLVGDQLDGDITADYGGYVTFRMGNSCLFGLGKNLYKVIEA